MLSEFICAVFCASLTVTETQILPLSDHAPASVNLLSALPPASGGRSSFDSGQQTLSPAGLEEHKGQRCGTAGVL